MASIDVASTGIGSGKAASCGGTGTGSGSGTLVWGGSVTSVAAMVSAVSTGTSVSTSVVDVSAHISEDCSAARADGGGCSIAAAGALGVASGSGSSAGADTGSDPFPFVSCWTFDSLLAGRGWATSCDFTGSSSLLSLGNRHPTVARKPSGKLSDSLGMRGIVFIVKY